MDKGTLNNLYGERTAEMEAGSLQECCCVPEEGIGGKNIDLTYSYRDMKVDKEGMDDIDKDCTKPKWVLVCYDDYQLVGGSNEYAEMWTKLKSVFGESEFLFLEVSGLIDPDISNQQHNFETIQRLVNLDKYDAIVFYKSEFINLATKCGFYTLAEYCYECGKPVLFVK